MTPPRKPTAGFWITVVLFVVLVGYPLTFGPACWTVSRRNVGASSLHAVYWPLLWGMSLNQSISVALYQYAELGAARDWHWRDFTDYPYNNPDKFFWVHKSATASRRSTP